MTQDPHVVRRQVEITNPLGLHLRPAEKFVRLAHQFKADIHIHHKGKQFNGKSILDLATLTAERGTQLDLEACGPDAAEALAALVELVVAQFYEAEENAEPGQEKDAPS